MSTRLRCYAQAVIYAATCDWSADQRKRSDGSPLQPAEDLRYYARGVFTWPQVRRMLVKIDRTQRANKQASSVTRSLHARLGMHALLSSQTVTLHRWRVCDWVVGWHEQAAAA
jgi:hypothetical protein